MARRLWTTNTATKPSAPFPTSTRSLGVQPNAGPFAPPRGNQPADQPQSSDVRPAPYLNEPFTCAAGRSTRNKSPNVP